MKKKTLLKLIFTASCFVAVCSLSYNNETSTLGCLASQNIEHWPKAKMMKEPIALVAVRLIAEATK